MTYFNSWIRLTVNSLERIKVTGLRLKVEHISWLLINSWPTNSVVHFVRGSRIRHNLQKETTPTTVFIKANKNTVFIAMYLQHQYNKYETNIALITQNILLMMGVTVAVKGGTARQKQTNPGFS